MDFWKANSKAHKQYPCVKDFTPAAIEAETESLPVRKPNPVADAIEAVFRP